jgi:hypothetical protein
LFELRGVARADLEMLSLVAQTNDGQADDIGGASAGSPDQHRESRRTSRLQGGLPQKTSTITEHSVHV